MDDPFDSYGDSVFHKPKDDVLTHKTGKASDLEAQFEETLTEFAYQVAELHTVIPPPTDFSPEIQKAKQRLLDAVANTTIMDPS